MQAKSKKRKSQVLLTPLAGDGGCDVIAVRKGELRLIQCKHTLWNASIEADAIAEILQALDGYRARWLRPLTALRILQAILVTNGRFTSGARAVATERGIEIVAEDGLWQLVNAI